jgi:hypothetical protein
MVLVAFWWLGGGIMKQISPFTANSKQKMGSTVMLSKDDPNGTTPAIVRWIVETSQPMASELRGSINSWWEGQKVTVANQLIKWLTQQQQYITSGLQTQLSEVIKKALGVNSAPSQ